MRTSPRTEFSTLWDNSPTNTSRNIPDHPLTGITSTPTGLPQSENLHPLEESGRRATGKARREPPGNVLRPAGRHNKA